MRRTGQHGWCDTEAIGFLPQAVGLSRCQCERQPHGTSLSTRGIVKLSGGWHSRHMTSQTPNYHGYRFPPEIISHAVWLYHRFCLSFRDAEDLLAQRGVTVTYETIRHWCHAFGPRLRSAAAARTRAHG